jgi:hypothetical protein
MDKFIGKPKGQKVAATVEEGEGELGLDTEEVFKESKGESAAATTALTLA